MESPGGAGSVRGQRGSEAAWAEEVACGEEGKEEEAVGTHALGVL